MASVALALLNEVSILHRGRRCCPWLVCKVGRFTGAVGAVVWAGKLSRHGLSGNVRWSLAAPAAGPADVAADGSLCFGPQQSRLAMAESCPVVSL